MSNNNSDNNESISHVGNSPSDEEKHPPPQSSTATTTNTTANPMTTNTTNTPKEVEKPNDALNCEGTPQKCPTLPASTATPSYAERNSQFFISTQPLERQFDWIESEFSTVETLTMNPSQYNFTTSCSFPTKNRYINVMANEETLFPPLRSPLAVRSSAKETRSTGQKILDSLRGTPASTGESKASANDESSILKANNVTASSKNVPLYFNANVLDMGVEPIFVASQAPVLDCIEDFLNAIYNYQIPLVLMLTEQEEAGFVKADRYWPADNGNGVAAKAFGNMAVYKDPKDPYTVDTKHELIWRRFFIRPCNAPKQEEHKITMVQYVGWPDRGVPDSTESFEELLRIIAEHTRTTSKGSPSSDLSASTTNSSGSRSNDNPEKRKPSVLVHCSAGIGRTGTLIGAHTAIKLMEAGKLNRDSIRNILLQMRKARFGMVQRVEQYMFLYLIVLQHLGADTTQFTAQMQQRADLYNYRWMEARQASMAARQSKQPQ